MDGLQEGAGLGEESAAQQDTQRKAAQTQQVADNDSGAGAPKDGSVENARDDYEAALAERDARIAELEGQIAEAAKTAESAEKLRAEMDELRRQGEEQRVSFELTMAGVRNVKAATALLPDYDNDIERLKAAEPWLFSAASAPAPVGATGLPNAGAASDAGATLKRWRRIAGLDDEGKEE